MSVSVPPVQQPPIEDIRNALQVLAPMIGDRHWAPAYLQADLETVDRLLRHALTRLGEPTAAMLEAVQQALTMHPKAAESMETPESFARYIRDTAAAILDAQLRGGL